MTNFSVVTVVLNDLLGLKDTYESLYSQSFSSFEWLVIDGESIDGTVSYMQELVEVHDNIVFVSQGDNGIYDAMNKGSERATGEYTVFMNAGDIFYNNTVLSDISEAINFNHSNIDIICGGSVLKLAHRRELYRDVKELDYLSHGLLSNHQATYYKTDLLRQNPYDISYKLCGDYFIIAKLIRDVVRKESIFLFRCPIVVFRVGDTSYRNPLGLIREANRVQREILGLSIYKRLYSMFRRSAATVLLMLIYELSSIGSKIKIN